MSTTYRLFITMAMMAAALSASAQERIDKAIDDFLNDNKNVVHIISQTKEEELVSDVNKKALYSSTDFMIERSDRDKLEKLRDAFVAESANAYKVMMKNANSGNDTEMAVGYGAKLDKTVTFGTHSDRNYIVLNVRRMKNLTDTNWRWSYGLVWYDSKEKSAKSKEKYIKGSITVVYSLDPASNNTQDNTTIHRTTILPDGTVVTYNDTDKTKTVVYKNGNVIKEGDSEYSHVNSSSEFLVVFGNLRSVYLNAYKEQTGLAIKSTVANRLLDLCKNKGEFLSKDEKNLCSNTLMDMSRDANDEYVMGILKMAADALK